MPGRRTSPRPSLPAMAAARTGRSGRRSAPWSLRSGLLPVLVDQVPEEHFLPVLDALRAIAQRLYEEDDSDAMNEVRHKAELRGKKKPD